VLASGDWIAVKTPGGGGYGPAEERDPAMVERDVARGYFTDVEAVRRFGAKPDKNFVDVQAASPSSWKTACMARLMVW
jgi:N-methylhydantoinase B/oxoprolinase/acetone carboxylase alpha subunit